MCVCVCVCVCVYVCVCVCICVCIMYYKPKHLPGLCSCFPRSIFIHSNVSFRIFPGALFPDEAAHLLELAFLFLGLVSNIPMSLFASFQRLSLQIKTRLLFSISLCFSRSHFTYSLDFLLGLISRISKSHFTYF